MITRQQHLWNWITAGAFIAMNAVCVALEFYFFALLPLVLAIVWAAFMRLDWLMFFIVACVPFSLNLEQMDLGGIGFYLPTEPLLAGVLIIFIFKLLSGKSIDRRIFLHPVSLFLYFYLAWMAITSLTSEMPVVSLKFLLVKMWFIAGFYFIMVHIFQNFGNIRKFYLTYLIPLIGVISYTVIRHAGYGFEKDPGHWVMEPFFKDHTSYGAVLAMFFPVAVAMLLSRKMNPLLRAILLIFFGVLCIGIILSYTRAAWVSIAAAGALMVFMLLRIKLRTLVVVFAALVSFVWVAQDQLLISLERNKQDSSDDLAEHVESISNVSSDASNLERLNRWNCALAMFEQRPVVGWGPGVYQFVYAPFQRSQDLTIISTNNADGGNAHSEYLGPLSEQGVLGMANMVFLVLLISALAFRLAYTNTSYELKLIIFSSFLGLITYFVHGVLNNYLDTDKASAPFWGFIAVLVAVDIFHNGKEKPEEEQAGKISL
ncbi:MAG: O-antigen ligase family protein [Flavobacteriales bacterium]|nr:O-antigen ligase family protein [Flavobacteriales bacterium]